MIIGIVSDSHGDIDRLHAAMGIFKTHNLDVVVHCGDVGSIECVDILGNFEGDTYLVAGNSDRHIDRLAEQAHASGITFAPESICVELGDGQYLAATHGHNVHIFNELIAGGQFAYVCHGHSHRVRDERIGGVRVINPGALHHPRGHHPTAAILDTKTDTLEHFDVNR